MKTVKELYAEAFEMEEPYLVYYIYYLTQKGFVGLHAPVQALEKVKLTHAQGDEFRQLMKQDILSVRPIKMYAIPRGNKEYAIYFAQDEHSAANYHHMLYKEHPQKMYDVYERMIHKSIYVEETRQFKPLREVLQESPELPFYVGEMEGKW